jgi:hypothetical protein
VRAFYLRRRRCCCCSNDGYPGWAGKRLLYAIVYISGRNFWRDSAVKKQCRGGLGELGPGKLVDEKIWEGLMAVGGERRRLVALGIKQFRHSVTLKYQSSSPCQNPGLSVP